MRITPKILNETIENYNRYLEDANIPFRFANHPQYKWQQLVLLDAEGKNSRQLAQGTSKECLTAISPEYNRLYRLFCQGEREIEYKIFYIDGTIYENTFNMHYTYSVHTFIKNLISGVRDKVSKIEYNINHSVYVTYNVWES